ncbi:hypothetical protein Tco_0903097, partial [Tanacetum coccineum]
MCVISRREGMGLPLYTIRATSDDTRLVLVAWCQRDSRWVLLPQHEARDSGPDLSFDIPASPECMSGLARANSAEVQQTRMPRPTDGANVEGMGLPLYTIRATSDDTRLVLVAWCQRDSRWVLLPQHEARDSEPDVSFDIPASPECMSGLDRANSAEVIRYVSPSEFR